MLQNCGAPRGRKITAAAWAAAIVFRLSVAASRLEVFSRAVFLGLTPQAMDMPPLRGWFEPSRTNAGGYSRATANKFSGENASRMKRIKRVETR